MSDYRDYLNKTKLHNNTIRKRRRRRFMFGIVLSAVLVFGIVFGHESISGEFNCAGVGEVMDVISSAVSQIGDRKLPIYSVETSENKIALSFDAAWGAEDFQNIMDVLDAHDVKVTFFMTGGWVNDNPDCVRELVDKGHELGNHSEHHYDMTTISKDEMKTEIMNVHDAVKELTGYEMHVFRPPYGAYNNELIDMAYDCDYYPIEWSVDSLDWKNYGVQPIIDTVCNHKELGGGAIILCHNGAKYTAQALDELLNNLEGKGYTIVPVSELIMTENYHMDANGRQIAD
ncbi:MAG: polysaccharide deacetylase family protein [Lachnospiraceae bacterium]|nr:polysaccharide deacetylase family protein [Lachnospiraceae bacterium]MDY6155307.1 polysaccharide deacetylase family protein [Agathobacter sp.]MEE1034958.1 polysaccharide deacetylase family protein [Agathobacter sp.]